MAVQLLLHFGRQSAHLAVVQIDRQRTRIELGPARDLLALALDIAFVLRLNLHLLGDRGVRNPVGRDAVVVHLWAAEKLVSRALFLRASAHKRSFQAAGFAGDCVALAIERIPAGIADKTQLAPHFGQAQVGVVLAQHEAVFSATSEHAVRL
jgi:hypothetical protein